MHSALEEVLTKYNKAPGYCSEVEIGIVDEFLDEYRKYRDVYKRVFGHEPIGLTIESQMDKVDWYKQRIKYYYTRKKNDKP